MDQAMGDLQAQLEEVKRLWDEERGKRETLEKEAEMLKAQLNEQASQLRKRSAEGEGSPDADSAKKQRVA